jgi:NTE family protein
VLGKQSTQTPGVPVKGGITTITGSTVHSYSHIPYHTAFTNKRAVYPMRHTLTWIFIGIAGCFQPLLAQDTPQLCLALSGGGAKGIAHIGVLKALEELRIPVRCIAGTSAGSLVGGLYASGKSPAQIQKAMQDTSPQELFLPRNPSFGKTFQDRMDERRYFSILEFGLKRDRVVAPSGINDGSSIMEVLGALTAHVMPGDFRELNIPFAAVATDINSGQSATLLEGNITLAMRASMSIPGVFEPVKWDDMLLVDGGILNNLPVDVARELARDLNVENAMIVAVDITSALEPLGPDAPLTEVTGQSINVALIQNTMQSMRDADLVISPDLENMDFGSFDQLEQLVQAGYEATMHKKAMLQAFQWSPETYQQWLSDSRQPSIMGAPELVNTVRVTGGPKNALPQAKAIAVSLEQRPLDPQTIHTVLDEIGNLGNIHRVSYRTLRDMDERLVVVINLEPKPWGPNLLRFGFLLESDFNLDTHGSLRLQHQRHHLNPAGGRWRTDLNLGRNGFLESRFHQPLGSDSSNFVSPYLFVGQDLRDIYDDDFVLNRERLSTGQLGLDFGRDFQVSAARLGVFRGVVHADSVLGGGALPEYRHDQGGFRFRYDLGYAFAHTERRSGFNAHLQWHAFRTSLASDHDYDRYRTELNWRLPVGEYDQFDLTIKGAKISGDNLPASAFVSLGGVPDLAGFPRQSLIGRSAAFMEFSWLWGLESLATPLGVPSLKTGIHAGNVWDSGFDFDDLRFGASTGFLWEILNSRVYLGAGYTEGGKTRYYLQIGQPWQ